MHARETSGGSGTSTPRMLMSRGRGVHRTSHALFSNLWNSRLVNLIFVVCLNDVRRTRKAPYRSLSTGLKTCIRGALWHD